MIVLAIIFSLYIIIQSFVNFRFSYKNGFIDLATGPNNNFSFSESDNDPYISTNQNILSPMGAKEISKSDKKFSVSTLLTKQEIIEMENTPAYIRRNVVFDKITDNNNKHDEMPFTRSTTTLRIGDDDSPIIGSTSYLHDNVD